MDPESTRGKIIQKRSQKKERYAKMVRIRQRKQQNTLYATAEPIVHENRYENSLEDSQLPMGFYMGEKGGKLDTDTDMRTLNKEYLTNYVDVSSEDDKVLTVNLNPKNVNKKVFLYRPEMEAALERNPDPNFKFWVNRLKNFTNQYKELVEQNKSKFESNKVDNQSLAKYNSYQAKCQELRKYKSSVEIVQTFTKDSFAINKLNFNSKFINKLHYEFDEFIDMILKKGIPRLRHTKTENGGIFGKMMDCFKIIFQKPIMSPPREVLFIKKNGDLQKFNVQVMMAGNFVRKAAEVSLFISLEAYEPVPCLLAKSSQCPLYIAERIMNDTEKKQFLMKYYPMLYLQMVTEWKATEKSEYHASSIGSTEDDNTEHSLGADFSEMSEEDRKN